MKDLAHGRPPSYDASEIATSDEADQDNLDRRTVSHPALEQSRGAHHLAHWPRSLSHPRGCPLRLYRHPASAYSALRFCLEPSRSRRWHGSGACAGGASGDLLPAPARREHRRIWAGCPYVAEWIATLPGDRPALPHSDH